MYLDVAKKYKDDPKAIDYLVKKIINGGGGVWGETPMAAHPQLPVADVAEIVKYVLSLGQENVKKSLPAKGTYTLQIPKDVSDQGALILRAAYTDKGANGISPVSAEKVMVLKNASIPAGKADQVEGIQRYKAPGMPLELMIGSANQSYLKFNQVDLTDIDQIACLISSPEAMLHAAGGVLEVHIDSPTGALIGQSSPIKAIPGPIENVRPYIETVKLSQTNGRHDVYYVFKNEISPVGQPLFILTNVQYVPVQKLMTKVSLSKK